MVHLSKFKYLLICLIFSYPLFSQDTENKEGKGTLKETNSQELKIEERVIISSDLIALKIGKKVFFLSDLNNYLSNISKLSCLNQEVLLLKSSDLKLQNYAKIKRYSKERSQANLIQNLTKMLQIAEYVKNLDSKQSISKLCREVAKDDTFIASLLYAEAYLSTRFKRKEADLDALKVFIDTIIQKSSYEILL